MHGDGFATALEAEGSEVPFNPNSSLTELTSRAMLVWLSERRCRSGTRDGAMSWG